MESLLGCSILSLNVPDFVRVPINIFSDTPYETLARAVEAFNKELQRDEG
jgi:hypothetical protein